MTDITLEQQIEYMEKEVRFYEGWATKEHYPFAYKNLETCKAILKTLKRSEIKVKELKFEKELLDE